MATKQTERFVKYICVCVCLCVHARMCVEMLNIYSLVEGCEKVYFIPNYFVKVNGKDCPFELQHLRNRISLNQPV